MQPAELAESLLNTEFKAAAQAVETGIETDCQFIASVRASGSGQALRLTLYLGAQHGHERFCVSKSFKVSELELEKNPAKTFEGEGYGLATRIVALIQKSLK